MTKEIIQDLIIQIKKLQSEKSKIESQIFEANKKLLPWTYSIEEEFVDLEHLGHYTNYYFISKNDKIIGKNHQDKESAILDAWDNSIRIRNDKS